MCNDLEGTNFRRDPPAIRNSGKKSATDQKRWQISKNDLYKFDSQFSIEFKNKIKQYIPQYFPNVQ
jgi:hypothetical protein